MYIYMCKYKHNIFSFFFFLTLSQDVNMKRNSKEYLFINKCHAYNLYELIKQNIQTSDLLYSPILN